MPSSLEANIGVSVKLQLNFKNIDIILKLLSSQAKLIIYGLSKPIDRDCKFDDSENIPPYFDNRILQKLSGLKNEEEFIEYSLKVAEMRGDKMVLRKKIEYLNFEDEGEVDDYLEILDESNDDFDDLENDSENDSENNSENETQENIVTISDQERDKKKLKKRYEESKIEQKYVNYDLNEKKISFLFYINLLNFGLSLNLRSEYDTDFGTLGKLSEFMNDINKATKFFTDLGIDEESLSVFNYNSSEGY
jgi:hypothetical protein